MATKLYPRLSGLPNSLWSSGNNDAKADGSASAWQVRGGLSTSPGASMTFDQAATVDGPTSGIEVATGGLPIAWVSEPLAADITISGTVTFNVWGLESSMNANVGPQVIIERIDSVGALSTIVNSEAASEFGTSAGVKNWTASPTSTNMKRGDRIRVRLLGNDVGTMATGFTFNIRYDGPTGGADGDTWVQFNENLTFESAPGGSVLYLTDTASAVSTSSLDKEAWTSRGSGSVNSITNTANGWTSPIHATDSGGGTVIDWFTKPLGAFTLGGRVDCNIRARESNAAANASLRVEIAVCNGDGSGATVWGAANLVIGGELTTTDAAKTILVSGPNTSVSDGQRLRIRLYVDDDYAASLVTGHTVTVTYSGTSAAAAGDTYLTLQQTVTEADTGTVRPSVGSLLFTGLAVSLALGISAGAGALRFTGHAPSVNVQKSISVPVGTLRFTGQAPSLARAIGVPVGTLRFAGSAPTVGGSISVQPSRGLLSLAGRAPAVSIGINRSTPVGALRFTGQAPALARGVSTGVGSLKFTGQAPSVSIGQNVGVPVGALRFTGQAPAVSIAGTGTAITVPVGALDFSGVAPSLSHGLIRSVPVGAIDFTGQAPSLANSVTPSAGQLRFTGQAPAVSVGINLSVPVGALDFTGAAPSLSHGLVRSTPVGSLDFNGQAPALGHALAVGSGQLRFTGQAPSLGSGLNVTVPVGSLEFAGAAPSVQQAFSITVPVGSLKVTGHAPNLVGSGAIVPGVGSLVFTGHALSLAGTISTGAGLVRFTGQAPSVSVGITRAVPVGTLRFAGAAPSLARQIAVPVGSLEFTGQAPTVGGQLVVSPGVGSLEFAGQAASLGSGISVQVGSLEFTGNAPSLNQATTITVPAGALDITGQTPVVAATAHVLIEVPAGSWEFAGQAPSVPAADISELAYSGSYVPTVTGAGSFTADLALSASQDGGPYSGSYQPSLTGSGSASSSLALEGSL